MAICSGRSKRRNTSSSGDGTEPVYNPGTHSFYYSNDLDSYADLAAMDADLGPNRFLAPVSPGDVHLDMDECGSLITGYGGTGQAWRMRYGANGTGGAYDIFWGPETWSTNRSDWHFQCQIRLAPGNDPATNDNSGIKGFMFWCASGRYEAAFNRLTESGGTPGPTRFLKFFNPNNADSGLTVWKTADGKAPLLSTYADSNWHRVTFRIRTHATDVAQRGAQIWLDGTRVYDDYGVDVQTGQTYPGYSYSSPVRYFKLLGNIPNWPTAPNPVCEIDIDNIKVWAP